jgi:PleD family two-component response regulator
MSNLTTPEDFETVLRFAFGIADRGVPLTLVSMAMVSLAVSAQEPDAVLEERLRGLVAGRCRRTDRVAALGQGRYRALLAVCNRQGALIFADRVVQAVEELLGDAGVSLACGVATWTPEMSAPEQLVAAADQALERAREMGGDRIEIHVG